MCSRIETREVISAILFLFFIEDLKLFLHDYHTSGLSSGNNIYTLVLFSDDMVILGNLQNSSNMFEYLCLR